MASTKPTHPQHYQDEFHARKPPSQPSTEQWHKPGDETSNGAVPESRAEVFPSGTAPPEHTFKPNPVNEFPVQGATLGEDSSFPSPPEMPGATSKDVHAGLGLPLQGLESREVNPQLPGKKSQGVRAHTRGRKKEENGLVGVGVEPKKDPWRSRGLDLPEGVEKGSRGKHTTDWPGAEDRIPATAEEVAAD